MATRNKKVQLEVALDVSGVVDPAKRAEDAVGKIGDGAPKSAEKVERATRSIAAAIERATVLANTGQQRNADYYESLGKLRGADAATLGPYIAQLRAAEAAQAAAVGGLGKMEISAKQTANALRGVPAQFTDIFVSLQGGQAPLTVLLQQGGQLKDMFGGAGAAAQAMGGYVLGLINPFTLAAAAVGALAYGYTTGAAEAETFQRTIIKSGSAAGVSAAQLSAMAQAVERMGGGTQAKAAEVLNQIATSGLIGAHNMQRFTAAAIEFERAGGSAAAETVKAFEELGREPLKAALKLNEAQNYLTRGTYERIKALEDQGNAIEAARVAQEAYADALENRTPAMADSLGIVQRAWRGVGDAAKAALDTLLNVGRDDTLQQQIDGITVSIDRWKRQAEGGGLLGVFAERQIESLREAKGLLQEQARIEGRSAAAQADQARQLRLLTEYRKEDSKYLSASAKLNADITREIVRGVAAGEDMARVQERVAAIRANATKGSGTSAGKSPEEKSLERQASLLADLSGISSTFSRDLADLYAAKQRVNMSDERYNELLEELLQKQPVFKALSKDQAEAARDEARALADAIKAREQWTKSMDQAIAGQDRTLQALREELIELQAGKQARAEVVMLRLQESAATYEQLAATMAMAGEDDDEIKRMRTRAGLLREEAILRGQVAAATAKNEVDAANLKAAEKALSDWQRTSDQIGQSLADALMAGGKDAGEYLQGMFRTMVLRPMIQAAVQPIAGAITGAMGFAQPAGAAAGGFGNLAGMAGMAGSLGTFGTTLGMGASATMAGSSMAAFSGAGSMIGAGNVAGGVGMGLGASVPYIAAAMAIYAIAKSLDDSGTPHMGSVVSGSGMDLRTLMGDRSTITENLNKDTDQALRALVQSSTGILSALGGGQYSATARFAADNTDPSIGQFTFAKDGRQVGFLGAANSGSATGDGSDYTRYASDAGTGLKEFTADVVKLTRAQLDTLDLPGWAQTQLDKLGQDADLSQLAGVAAAIETTTAEIANLRTALGPLSGVFAQFAGLTSDAVFELADAFGGSAALAQTAAGYYQAFYSEAERAADGAKQVTAALAGVGLEMPGTRDAFRGLVEAQDLTTETGREAFAALMSVSGAFAELNPIMTATADDARAAADVMRERLGLEAELLQLQGDTDELRRRALAELDPSNRALQQSIYAYQDQQAAAAAAADAMSAAASSAQQYLDIFDGVMAGLGDSRFELENELLALGGQADEVARRTRERDLTQLTAGLSEADAEAARAAYDYNAALRAQVDSLQGARQSFDGLATTVVQAADTTRDAMASVWSDIGDEIRRLRGLTKSGPESIADAAAQFALATAQARAGDAEAAKRLPSLSRQLDDLAEANSTSASQLAILRGRAAASLEGTLGATGGSLPDLRADVQQLRADLVAAMAQNAGYSQRTAKALERAMPDGDALATRAAT